MRNEKNSLHIPLVNTGQGRKGAAVRRHLIRVCPAHAHGEFFVALAAADRIGLEIVDDGDILKDLLTKALNKVTTP